MNVFQVVDATAMGALGAHLGQVLGAGGVVYLMGDLGAGKTTLVRGVLQGLGYRGKVRSPTYTMMENYQIDNRSFQHLDLYRIRQPEELEYLGVRDLDTANTWVFIEWPEQGAGRLPAADLEARLDYLDPGRGVSMIACNERGRILLEAWKSRVLASPMPGVSMRE